MSSSVGVSLLGFGLIAVCYGFARFAFGLFVPQIREDIALSSTLIGVISGSAFAIYCVAIMLAARLSERYEPKCVALAAIIFATGGMFGIAYSTSAVWLAFFVILAGISTGLASPPMAEIVRYSVMSAHRDMANTVINAGTSAGVVASGLVAIFLAKDWRVVFIAFAGLAAAMAILTFLILPKKNSQQRKPSSTLLNGSTQSIQIPASEIKRSDVDWSDIRTPETSSRKINLSSSVLFTPNVVCLILAAFIMGASSTALWSFGGSITELRLQWSGEQTGLLWVAIGSCGVLGAGAGWLTSIFGINWVHRVFLVVLAISIAMVGMEFTSFTLTMIGGAFFGCAYVMLTGVYLVWGTAALVDRAATGVMIGFVAIAAGQTMGAPLFGVLLEHASLHLAILVFSVMSLVPGIFYFQGREANGELILGTSSH